MSQLLLTLRYDGTRYHGWQVQPNGITVQETLQDAVESATGTRLGITGCSRTDAGVHARHFCCTMASPAGFFPASLQKALNALLPEDVAVTDCRIVPDSFHPRYNVVSKRYVYRIWNSPIRNPFERRYSMMVRGMLNEQQLNQAAQLFVGRHDFSAFCSAGSSVEDRVRTVFRSEVRRDGDLVTYTVEADGFLYNMVRILTGTLLDIQTGKRTQEDIRRALETGNRSLAGATVPPQGLFLEDVRYQTEALYEAEN